MNTPAVAERLEVNRTTVLDFYERALNHGDFEAAAIHFGPRYVQHNPMLQDGVEGFRAFLREFKKRCPASRGDIKRVFAVGDFVILHVHARREPDDPGIAIVDIFRLESGKIVEHWDVRQPILENPMNPNGMF